MDSLGFQILILAFELQTCQWLSPTSHKLWLTTFTKFTKLCRTSGKRFESSTLSGVKPPHQSQRTEGAHVAMIIPRAMLLIATVIEASSESERESAASVPLARVRCSFALPLLLFSFYSSAYALLPIQPMGTFCALHGRLPSVLPTTACTTMCSLRSACRYTLGEDTRHSVHRVALYSIVQRRALCAAVCLARHCTEPLCVLIYPWSSN